MKIFVLVTSLLFSVNINAENESNKLVYSVNTGELELDTQLINMNKLAFSNLNSFFSNMNLEYEKPTWKLKHLMHDYNFSPADIYLTLAISHITNSSLHDVAHKFKDNKTKGWGYVIQSMGINVNSAEFELLKKNLWSGDAQ